jgi:ammonia channel protein AmtB
MFPIDHEFTMVYALYILLFSYISYRLIIGGRGEKFRLICIVSISLALNIFLYIDPANFQGGASLVVLFYSLIIGACTALITVVNRIFSSWKKKV